MHDELLSVVIAPGRTPEQVLKTIDHLSAFLPPRFRNFEIIVVCDHSNPSFAFSLSERVAATRNLRVLTLARDYGSSIATLAGLQHAIGDYTVLLDTDADPEIIDQLHDALTPEFDVVFAVDETRQDWKNKLLHGMERLSQLPVTTGHSHAALLRRQSLNAILTLRERIVHLPLLATYLGLRTTTINTSQSSPLTVKTLAQQLESICAYSPWPLIMLSILVLGLTGTGTILSLLHWLLSGFSGSSFMMFICMLGMTGIAGLMVLVTSFTGRILQETKRQPFYQVVQEVSSRKVEIGSIVQRR